MGLRGGGPGRQAGQGGGRAACGPAGSWPPCVPQPQLRRHSTSSFHHCAGGGITRPAGLPGREQPHRAHIPQGHLVGGAGSPVGGHRVSLPWEVPRAVSLPGEAVCRAVRARVRGVSQAEPGRQGASSLGRGGHLGLSSCPSCLAGHRTSQWLCWGWAVTSGTQGWTVTAAAPSLGWTTPSISPQQVPRMLFAFSSNSFPFC